MPNQLTLLTYPFDPTGQALSNRITGEQHAVQEANYRDYYYIVPTYAPLFEHNVVITYLAGDGSSRVLVPDVDYYFALPFLGATRSIGIPLYGAITLNNSIIDGTISIDYRTLGGEWTTDPAAILANLATLMYNPRVALWDVVTNKPAVFPPIVHPHNIDSIFGAEAVINAINELAGTIANSSGTTIVINDTLTGGGSGGSGGSGGTTTNSSDTFAIVQDRDRVLTGDTLTLNVIAQGGTVPDTLYWSMVMWNATSANFNTVSGTIAMSTLGGVKRGTIQIACTNNLVTPVGFNVLLRVDSIGGDVVAISDLLFVTRGDISVVKSGQIDLTNSTKSGLVFANEQNTGLSNPAPLVMDAIVGGTPIIRLDHSLNSRTMFYGPNNAYRMVWQPDGNVEVFDDNDVVIFSIFDAASKAYVQTFMGLYATTQYVDDAVNAAKVPMNKLYYFAQLQG